MILMGGNQRELPSDSTVASDLQLPRKKDSIQNDPGCCCCTQFCVLQLLLYILSINSNVYNHINYLLAQCFYCDLSISKRIGQFAMSSLQDLTLLLEL